MKKSFVVTVWILLNGVAQSIGNEEYRIFTSTDGRAMDAKIIDHNPKKNQVQLERRDGKKAWIGADAFSENDCTYINEWIKAHRILSEKLLRVSVEKNIITRKDSGNQKNVEGFCHEITLSNRGGEPIDGLKIEYRYFMQLFSGTVQVSDPKRMLHGKINVDHMDALDKKTVRTKRVRNFEEYPDGNQYVVRSMGRCAVDGVWIRIHGPSINGVPTYRDICDPESLLYQVEWDEERTAMKDHFSFLTMEPPKANKHIVSPEDVRKRGLAETQEEYLDWMKQLYEQFRFALNAEEQQQLIEGFKFFYNSDYDHDGGGAAYAGSTCKQNGWLEDAVYWYEIALQGARKDDPQGIRKTLIRIYACAEDLQVRNGPRAVDYAEILLEEDEKDPRLMDLLARAYAANAQFEIAVKTQKNAIHRYEQVRKNRRELEEFKKRLQLYQNRQPYLISNAQYL